MAAPTDLNALSTTAGSNSPAGSDAIAATADDYLRGIQAVMRQAVHKGADIISATTTDLSATVGSYHDITGATTITSFGSTGTAGITKILQFDGALTLTNGASLILPGGANITTVAGDVGMFVCEGSGNWRCYSYSPAKVSPGKQPTRTVTTSGSGTYTTPTGATRLNLRMVGAGGGGGGGANAGGGTGGTGGSTTFDTFTAAGGVGGAGGTASSVGTGGAGGAASGSPDIGVSGGNGNGPDGVQAAPNNGTGGGGGNTAFGGAGQEVYTGNGGAGKTNSGAGGAGGGSSSSSVFYGGGGGGAGAYVETLITAPSATYAYGVGAAGTAGTGSFAGGAGGSGLIIVDEYYD